MAPSPESAPPADSTSPGNEAFRFVSIQEPGEAQGRDFQRSVRSHAVKQALQKKRRQEHAANQNFRTATTQERAVQTDPVISSPTTTLRELRLPPTSSFANHLNLQRLLGNQKAKQAIEPVFGLGDDANFQTFRSVFRAGLNDNALLNAVLLTTTFATSGNWLGGQSLHYQAETFKALRQRISDNDSTVIVSTIGAILLLAGIEIRLGMRSQTEIHLTAVMTLLRSTSSERLLLTDGIKRAIFWQDLYAHLITSTTRTVNHHTFHEMHWHRDTFAPEIFVLPAGFQTRVHILGEELTRVFEDIHALKMIRDSAVYDPEDTAAMIDMDNHEASVQSRLCGLPDLSPLAELCRLAGYLTASLLCCKIWRLSLVPNNVSAQMLQVCRRADDSIWTGHFDLLAWLLYLGGALAAPGIVRKGYMLLIRRQHASKLATLIHSWSDLVVIMEQFIWSEKAISPLIQRFWGEVQSFSK